MIEARVRILTDGRAFSILLTATSPEESEEVGRIQELLREKQKLEISLFNGTPESSFYHQALLVVE